MFEFGRNVGVMQGMLTTMKLYPCLEPSPVRWQKELNVRKQKSETGPQFKHRLHIRAKLLFPSDKITLKTADAALLAYYRFIM
jgi:hypothetical protein